MSSAVQTYLKYAHVQMAAEAFLLDPDTGLPYTEVGDLRLALLRGNEFNSKFTATLAAEFAANWEAVAHQPNTASGFSATLFRGIGEDNSGEMVLSFRSTEFIDDAVRDNQATNKMEIAAHGWAFGQIADMEAWYASLQASGKLPTGATFTVTGYSLGGHLATAFNLLHQHEGRIAAIYTFNGAGVGEATQGALAAVIEQFRALLGNLSAAVGGTHVSVLP